VRRVILLIAAGTVASSSGSAIAARDTGAAAFMTRVVRQIVSNDYEHAWLSLHPAQQQLVPQEDYVRCELQSPIAGRLVWIRTVRVASARFAVGGLKGRVAGKAVTLRIKLAADDIGASVVLTHTVHAVAVAGRWRWILPAERIELYSSSACAIEAPSGP
jgi:hypothetical protein